MLDSIHIAQNDSDISHGKDKGDYPRQPRPPFLHATLPPCLLAQSGPRPIIGAGLAEAYGTYSEAATHEATK